MQYDYERLTPDRFQELCQALIAKQHPTAKCFPVGQADGGRDVAVTEQLDGEPTSVVYQVKFRRSLQRSEDTYARIREAVRHERPKVQKLAARGATHYVLVTNLSGSSALDQGVRDRVDKLLRDELPIETQVWWREDIDARLNDSYDIKWSFSEIFTSSDLLRTLIEEGLGENASRRNMAIVSYMTSQYEQDEFVKFKQADLQASDLLALFIDVPASSQKATRETATRADMFAIRRILVATQEAGATGANALPRPDDLSVGGATLMLHPVGQSHFTSVVLEGGPGQGKSTLAQYVGQVHRMKLLGKTDRLTELPADHRLSPTRVPFKVDLRDFSSWLRRIDPFHADEDLPSLATQTLETFLAAQIEHLSGGQGFSVDDLRLYLSRVPALIILDGLDEVAAMVDRKDVIDSINAAHGRMTATAQSIQFLVTSRPAATAATPRFTDKRWQFVDLRPITEALIYGYAERWSAARRIPKRDIDEIKRILRSKLSSPHIKELSRNAMQLTILLQLIHSRGQALPDQRTELYDRYVDVLFNREADKNPVVLNNRQLLIDLHGFLAWKMHAGAQSRRSNGRISEEELQKLIGLYMTTKGHDPSAIDELFAGVVQRIVALVGRVEGTFEFEVQPLREYFAARHLYNTAPYSPTGSPQPGTKPEIFAAIAPQPYWLNVTRFFAGCYSMGELPGLADQLKQMLVEGDLALTSFPRVVATSLLTDRVFQQDPRVTSALAAATADPLTARFGLGRYFGLGDGPILSLPKDCGQKQLTALLSARAHTHTRPAIRIESALVLRDSVPSDLVFEEWIGHRPSDLSRIAALRQWLQSGVILGTVRELELADVDAIISAWPDSWRFLAQGGCSHVVTTAAEQRRFILEALDAQYSASGGAGEVGYLGDLLQFDRLIWTFRSRGGRFGMRSRQESGPALRDQDLARLSSELTAMLDTHERSRALLNGVAELIESTVGRCWASWLVEILTQDQGRVPEHSEAAASISHSSISSAVGAARLQRANSAWWADEFDRVTDSLERRALLAMLCLWGTPAVLAHNIVPIEAFFEALLPHEYGAVLQVLDVSRRDSGRPGRIPSRVLTGIATATKCVRALTAISTRSTREAEESLLRDLPVSALERDAVLADRALEAAVTELAEAGGPDSSERALRRAREVFQLDLAGILVGHGLYRSAAEILTRAQAVDVLRNADEYPIGIVQAADTVLSAPAVRSSEVGRVARQRKWAAG